MKTYFLFISKTFPGTHPKKGEPTFFAQKIEIGLNPLHDKAYDNYKLHTIRGNYPLWKKRFDEIYAGKAKLSVREWSGRPYHSNHVILHEFTSLDGIGIQKLTFAQVGFTHYLQYPHVDDNLTLLTSLAHNDGLSTISFKEWFKNYNLSEPLAIIHFTKFRYEKVNL